MVALPDEYPDLGHPLKTPMPCVNLSSDLVPAEATERLDTLFAGETTRIERIVSWGQASAADFWYDQPEGEWVALLGGKARLFLRDPDERVELDPGDWLWIAPHRRHRVDWTEPGVATVWLAVFVGSGAAPC
jgi:cupin 2 domain-containing protein